MSDADAALEKLLAKAAETRRVGCSVLEQARVATEAPPTAIVSACATGGVLPHRSIGGGVRGKCASVGREPRLATATVDFSLSKPGAGKRHERRARELAAAEEARQREEQEAAQAAAARRKGPPIQAASARVCEKLREPLTERGNCRVPTGSRTRGLRPAAARSTGRRRKGTTGAAEAAAAQRIAGERIAKLEAELKKQAVQSTREAAAVQWLEEERVAKLELERQAELRSRRLQEARAKASEQQRRRLSTAAQQQQQQQRGKEGEEVVTSDDKIAPPTTYGPAYGRPAYGIAMAAVAPTAAIAMLMVQLQQKLSAAAMDGTSGDDNDGSARALFLRCSRGEASLGLGDFEKMVR